MGPAERCLLRDKDGTTVYYEGAFEDISFTDPGSGQKKYFSALYSPHRSTNQEVIGVVITIHDTTMRRISGQDRENLLARERKLRLQAEALGRVSKALNAALISDRPYRKAWTHEATVAYIRKESGRHFDPQVVEAFLDHL